MTPVNLADRITPDLSALLAAAGGEVRGVGVDLANIEAFSAQLDVDGSDFVSSFTANERTLGNPSTPMAHRLAGRWAAKEAFIKAWSGVRRGHAPDLVPDEVRFADIEVLGDPWGRPGLRLHGAVAEMFAATVPNATAHLSISHDATTAIAVVVITTPAVGIPASTSTTRSPKELS